MGNNILLNPTLTGFSKPPRTFTDKTGNVGYMENPDHWEFVWTPMHEDDPNRVPQSLHRDRGYCIAAGWRVWEAGYVQRNVQLRGGQRYVAKAAFQPDVNFPNGPVDLTAVQWRFWIQSGDERVYTEWETTRKGEYKQPEEHLFVIEPRHDMAVDFYFKARSIWSSNVCDFNLYSLALEEVPADYGSPAYLGGGAVPAGITTTAPVNDGGGLPPIDEATAITLRLSNSDIDLISAGLRAMSRVTSDSAVLAAFNKLADALDAAKGLG